MLSKEHALEQLDLPFDTLNKILNSLKFNDFTSEFYRMYAEETGDPDYITTATRVQECYSHLFTKRYESEKVLNIETVFCCKNKFCPNCLKLIQASRLSKMWDRMQDDSQNYILFHLVLTLPNVKAKDLDYTCNIMREAFSKLIRYFSLNAKIKGMNFEPLGFYAAICSLEITYNSNKDDYHPHYHCILAFSKAVELHKVNVNKYSYDANNNYALVRKFSDLEITLQKLWRLLLDNIRIRDKLRLQAKYNSKTILKKLKVQPLTGKEIYEKDLRGVVDSDYKNKPKSTIQAERIKKSMLDKMSFEDGYSVVMDKVDDSNIYEVFKYAFKLTSEQKTLMQYEQFKTLLNVMYKRKQVQCYGAWYDMRLDDSIDVITIDALYYSVLLELENDAEQTTCCTTLQDVLEYKKRGWAVISKRQIMRFLKELDEGQRRQALEDICPVVDALRQFRQTEREQRIKQTFKSGIASRHTAPKISTGSLKRALIRKKVEYREMLKFEREQDKRIKESKAITALTDEQMQIDINKIF